MTTSSLILRGGTPHLTGDHRMKEQMKSQNVEKYIGIVVVGEYRRAVVGEKEHRWPVNLEGQ